MKSSVNTPIPILVLAIIFSLWPPMPGPLVRTQELPMRHMATNDEAKQFYLEANEYYFNNELPKDVTVRFVPYPTTDDGIPAMAFTTFGSPIDMVLDAEYRDNVAIWAESVLHESCHIQTINIIKFPGANPLYIPMEFDQHGEKWNGCMLDLAQQGAFKNLW